MVNNVMRGVTLINDGTAVKIEYKAICDFIIEVPVNELPFELDDVYEAAEATTDEEKLEALTDEIDDDLEAVVADYSTLEEAAYATFELDTTSTLHHPAH